MRAFKRIMAAILLLPAVVEARERIAPITASDRATLPNPADQFRWTVAEKAVAHRHFDLLFPSETVASAGHVRPLAVDPRPLLVEYVHDGRRLNLDEYFARTNASGLLVIKDDRILLERYGMGNGPDTTWTSRSMAKSVTSTLIGLAIRDGSIASLDDPIAKYLPELATTRYGAVTLRQNLRMTSGMPDTEFPSALPLQACTVKRQPGCFLAGIRAIADPARADYAAPGTRFSYLSADVIVSGMVLQRATGKSPARYLSEKVWRPLGMERDGYWNLEAPGGATFANSGLGATLRDYGRFGLFVMAGGVLPDGRRLLPDDWARQALVPSRASEIAGTPYGFNWWLNRPRGDAPGLATMYYARGSAGQVIAINPAERVVIVKWAVWADEPAKPSGTSAKEEDDELFDAVLRAAHGR